ncbi:hypothetical protein K491DRAFT_614447 [Lophiostoma macrostomum CBS 122681]|uniref:Methyltransferase domain-containing protein n=1 Tax=Lophiostoma macrostomum CBS 122681 TaxID=1314788 RepID=A0A6A6SMY1_9PLEO|nr:hypothetical protein K491DRAFT_614447 [Lophiostoma macrostomum CBS 122681]
MGPDSPLPLPVEFDNVEAYVDSLLNFTTSSWLLQTLCGGVHILDFYTREPDLYSTILPETWRTWFKDREVTDILDLLMREDLRKFEAETEGSNAPWRGGCQPPQDLLQYIKDVRKHLLGRDFTPRNAEANRSSKSIARHIAIGMKVKKVHEVNHFARYVDNLTTDIAARGKREITHLVDFGSGQNYLGRALAAPPYSKHMVAVESKQHNIEGAKNMDVQAKLVPKPLVMRNKKEYRARLEKEGLKRIGLGKKRRTKGFAPTEFDNVSSLKEEEAESTKSCDENGCSTSPAITPVSSTAAPSLDSAPQQNGQTDPKARTSTTTLQIYTEGHGSVQYVEHIIKDGDLSPVVDQILDASKVEGTDTGSTSKIVDEPTQLDTVPKTAEPNLMVISLHSCGNLVHHGLRSLLLNPAVSAVAMVGCCYNLVTERLGPPTFKLPTLRSNHPRLTSTSNAFDPNGFPMSEHMTQYPLPHNSTEWSNGSTNQLDPPRGIRLNITARMMAVQAPFNWGQADSELFFTRHFYRALLQRMFLDRGVVSAPVTDDALVDGAVPASGTTSKIASASRGPGLSSNGTNNNPLTIGTLRKFAYKDFLSYTRAAIAKLTTPNSFCEVDPVFIKGKLEGLTDDDILGYEEAYWEKKKELAIMWSLMAFSAGVVEAVIVMDRWLWLREQEEVEEAWVEPVFEYGLSPRNLVVVGIKK